MTVSQQFKVFIANLETRKRRPAKPATIAAYLSYFRTWIQPKIGSLELSQVENGVMKTFVAYLAESNLSPASIASISQLVKNIVSSTVDSNGNSLFPRKWNADFVDAPLIRSQNTPIIHSEAISEAIATAGGQYSVLFAMLAGTGLRVSEALSIKVGRCAESSYWDPEMTKIVINKALYRGKEQTTKTAAGVREVDLDPQFNDYLVGYFKDIRQAGDFLFKSQNNGPLRLQSIYDVAEKCSVPGMHSFRRFRCTHLENVGVPRGLAMYWTGHRKGSDIHDRYVQLNKDIAARKDWAIRAGLGFTLPVISHPMVPDPVLA